MKKILFILIFHGMIWSLGLNALLIPNNAIALSSSQAGIAGSYDESINPAYQIDSEHPQHFSFGVNEWYGDIKGKNIQYRWRNQFSNSIKINLWEISDLELRNEIPSEDPLANFGAEFASIQYNISSQVENYNYGFSLGLHYLGLFTESGTGATANLGIQRNLFDWLDFGLSIKNLGFFNYSFESDSQIPMVLGIGFQFPFKQINTKLVCDYTKDSLGHAVIRSGLQWSNSNFHYRLGLSKGEDYFDSTLGIGFVGNKWGLNLGVLSNSEKNLGLPRFIEIVFYPEF